MRAVIRSILAVLAGSIVAVFPLTAWLGGRMVAGR